MMSIHLTAAGKAVLRNGRFALTTPATVAAAPTPTTLALLVGMIGQSNMAFLSAEMGGCHYWSSDNRARRSVNGAHEAVGAYCVDNTIPPGSPYTTWGNSLGIMVRNSPDGDGIVTFANAATKAANTSILTYEYAQPGSNIESWMTGGAQWERFATAVRADTAGLNSAIFYQGEENAASVMTKDTYKARLRDLHNQLLALSGKAAADFYFGLVILGPGTTYAPEGRMGLIRQAQLDYVNDPANVGAHLAAVATDANLAGDTIHMNNTSQIVMGGRYAKSLAAWATGTGVGAQGPKIIGAARTGLQVDVTVQHSGGTALKDGAGGTGASAMGFRFFDAGAAGAQIACTPVGIVGANTIRLTLASSPVGVLTMDYAMANAPFGGTTAPASVLYDSDTVPDTTLGLPLQPCAPITVTGS